MRQPSTYACPAPGIGATGSGISAVDQLTLVVHGAFQQSLESLRRYVEEGIAWTASA
ncbi:MAG: hypothetical protein J2P15_07185 [Micromonosporaceae bacterium]|nr:hypothetical protein [Micromonosporaceae bacterium]